MDIYAATEDGVWLYEPKAHTLLPHSPADIRAQLGVQDFVATASLRIGQIEARAGRARSEEVDLSAILKRVGDAFETAAADADQSLTSTICPDIRIDGDPHLLAQPFAALSRTP